MVTELTHIERKIVELSKLEFPLSIEALGGIAELNLHCDTLASSPLLPLLFDAIITSFPSLTEEERFATNALVLTLLGKSTHDISFIDSVDKLINRAALFKEIAGPLTQVFIQRAQDKSAADLIRTASLQAAVQWAAQSRQYQFRILDALLGIQTDTESSDFLAHTVKIMGFAHAQWNEPELVEKIAQILEIDRTCSEALFEHAMTFLNAGIRGEDSETCYNSFMQSAQFFRLSAQESEVNPQALVFALAAELLCEFYQKNFHINVASYNEQLSVAIFEYEAWLKPDVPYSLDVVRRNELHAWKKLVEVLANTFVKIDEPSWNEATLVLEAYVLSAYSCSRTILGLNDDSGIELLVKPHMEDSITKPGLIHHLELWLRDNKWHSKYHIALALFNKSKLLIGSDHKFENNLVELALKDALEFTLLNITSAEKTILTTLLSAVSANPDYENSRIMINAIILNLVKFVANRLNITKKHEPSAIYLYAKKKEKVTESDFQMDIYRWLYGTCGSQIEISNIGGGRTDISCMQGSDRVVIEVKKEESDSSFQNLAYKYIKQTISYQVANIRIGFLAVLDMSISSDQPSPHITNLFHATEVQLQEEVDKRLVIILKLPGNRQYPSSFSRK